MIVAVDTETWNDDNEPVLNAQQFKLGCLIREDKKDNPEFFTEKEKMWNYILELGEIEKRKKRNLYVYAHNHEYDFYAYANIKDKMIRYYSTSPFLVNKIYNRWNEKRKKFEEKPYIYFFDTFLIYNKSLEKLGEIIELPKMEMPKNMTIQKAKPYVQRDAEIVLNFVLKMKETLKSNNVNVRKVISAGQIGINYFTKFLRKNERFDILDPELKNFGFFHNTIAKDEIHDAYRGGRVESFRFGAFKKVTAVDNNSLYPFAAMQIPFPDLRTETKLDKPLKTISQKELLNKIGVSKVKIIKTENGIGLLPIRTEKGNWYENRKGIKMIGTWTNLELKKAIENGYKILDIEYSILYEKTENPFKEIMPILYQKKQNENKFDKFVFKQIMNNIIGKMAQKNKNFKMFFDNHSKRKEYEKDGYVVNEEDGVDFLYKKDEGKTPAKYYAPIIPAYVTAWGRIFLWEFLKRIKEEDLIYCDTDSIIFTGNYLNLFKIGKEIGEWKFLYKNVKSFFYTRKTYIIDKEIKMSGVGKKWLNTNDFMKGVIKHQKMIGIKKSVEFAGMFEDETRNLKESTEKMQEFEEDMKRRKILIDTNAKDINYFVESL